MIVAHTRSRLAACELEVCLTALGGALKDAFLSENMAIHEINEKVIRRAIFEQS